MLAMKYDIKGEICAIVIKIAVLLDYRDKALTSVSLIAIISKSISPRMDHQP
jgi:hypothetical protein